MRALPAILLLLALPSAAAEVVLSERFVGYGPAHSTSSDVAGCDDDTNLGGACFHLPAADRLRFRMRSDQLVDDVPGLDDSSLAGVATWHGADGALLQIGWPCDGGDYPNPEGAAYVVVSIASPAEMPLHPSCPHANRGLLEGTISIVAYEHERSAWP